MNKKIIYTPKDNDPNKIKKCNCENKVGPKPFNDSKKYN